jgi:hypothetical protein
VSLYAFTLSIPANTTKAVPVEGEALLTAGFVRKVALRFPRNCAGLAHVVILHARHQVWPANEAEDLAADGAILEWADEYLLLPAGARLILVGWNDDDTYPHKISFWFNVEAAPPPEEAETGPGIVQRLRQAFGA